MDQCVSALVLSGLPSYDHALFHSFYLLASRAKVLVYCVFADWTFDASRLLNLARSPVIIFVNGERTKHWQNEATVTQTGSEHQPLLWGFCLEPRINQGPPSYLQGSRLKLPNIPNFNCFKERSWGFVIILNQKRTMTLNSSPRAVAF